MRWLSKPLTSLAVLGDTNPAWRPSTYQRTFLGTELHFHFPVVKLLDYQSQLTELEGSTNPFALLVAATLHVQQTKPDHPKRREAKFRLIRGLLESGLDRQKILAFFRLVDWIVTLSPEEDKRFKEDLAEYEQETKHMPYITSIERMGIEKGLELGLEQGLQRGRKQGMVDSLISVLSSRFGTLPERLPESLSSLEKEADLKALLNVAVRAAELSEFEAELAGLLA